MACSLAVALERVILIVELRSEQESNRNLALSRRNIADAIKRRVAKRVVDSVVIEELVCSWHCASCYVAQFRGYLSYLVGIVRKELFYNISQR